LTDDELHFTGEFLIIEEDRETGSSDVRFDNKGLGRVCGSCQLCCRLLPIPRPPLNKPAGQRCKHQRYGKGCAIHARRPLPCRTWSCRWLADPKAHDLPRPDHAHYVVDMVIDYITAIPQDGGEPRQASVVQVWVDPDFPDAHRDPKLRAYLLMMAEQFNCAAVIRYGPRRGFTLAAPPFAGGEWLEITSQLGPEHHQLENVDVVYEE